MGSRAGGQLVMESMVSVCEGDIIRRHYERIGRKGGSVGSRAQKRQRMCNVEAILERRRKGKTGNEKR
jgi:F420-0:gamma-glutamyl ligase